MIPVRCQLVVSEFARFAYSKLNRTQLRKRRWRAGAGSGTRQRKKIPVRWCSELIAFKCKQAHGDRVGCGRPKIFCEVRSVSCSAIRCRNIWDERADQRSWRVAASLPRTLIVHKEESEFTAGSDWPSETSPENILLNYRTR